MPVNYPRRNETNGERRRAGVIPPRLATECRPKKRESAFQRFERAASIRNYGGLGLGLYLIRAIVDAHGGSVSAENVNDGGARFQITLPLRPTPPDDDAPVTTNAN